jgi:hypothetical protein
MLDIGALADHVWPRHEQKFPLRSVYRTFARRSFAGRL